MTIPRIPLLNPFLISPFVPPFINMTMNKYKESLISEKKPELIINLTEEENIKSEIENDYTKKSDNNDLIMKIKL